MTSYTRRVLEMDLQNLTTEDEEFLHWIKNLAQKIFIRASNCDR